MLLRSGNKTNHKKTFGFDTCCINQSRFILEGGLKIPYRYEQVTKESYKCLAKLNRLGFVTIESLDHHYVRQEYALNGIPFNRFVHNTVMGFMRKETLEKLKKRMKNFSIANMALIHHIIKEEELQEEDDHRIILPVDYFIQGPQFQGINQVYVTLCYSRKDVDYFKSQVHINSEEPVEMVTFIDMQYNNNPNLEGRLFQNLIRDLERVEKEI